MKLASAILLASVFASTAAMADHNSIWGEGHANMPNDIHNTRIDTLGDDSDAFIAFVQYGAAADSVNRFLDDDSDALVTAMGGGSADAVRGGSVGSAVMGGGNVTRGGASR
ncbi:MAG TPA: hypothetical protein ENN42_04400 [Thioalkalivibrio sp.]|nr:hypothetical protein [Thioalkalivibrio sp.]